MRIIIPLTILLFVGLDQWVKYMATHFLKGQQDILLWPGVFHLSYVENRGAAFGMLQNKQWFLVMITLIVLIGVCFYWKRIPKSTSGNWLKVALILIIGGAIGNFIDRIVLGYVVDLFYFVLIDFPVFNVADIGVVVGVALLVPVMLWGDLDKKEGHTE